MLKLHALTAPGTLPFFFRVVLPLSKAILAVIVLYYGVQIWNSWFWASAILREREMYPLQVVLREILLQNSLGGMSTGVGYRILNRWR